MPEIPQANDDSGNVPGSRQGSGVRRSLIRIYAYYRFSLSVLLLGMYLSNFATNILGFSSGHFFFLTAITFVGLTTLGLAWQIRTKFNSQSYVLFFYLLTDIVILTLLTFSSGGLGSGIGLLLLISVATGSLIFSGQLTLFLAAIASILVMVGTAASVVIFDLKDVAFFPAGLLGVVLFATALLFRSLNRRLQESQNLAIREADQAAHLQRLNQAIINRMRTGIILVNSSVEVELINNAAIELLGGHRAGAPLARGIPLSSIPSLFKQYESWKAYPWLRCPPISTTSTNTMIQCNFAHLDEAQQRHTIIFIEDTRSTMQNAQQLKLVSLGRLAGSIAHEVRNPLGAISHAAQLLAEQGKTDASIQPLTDIINRHSDRVNSLIDSILQLSRQEAPDFQKLQLSRWLQRFSQEYNDLQSSPCTVIINDIDQHLQVLFDPVHLNQIITNLVDNAQRYSASETGEAWTRIDIHVDTATGLPCLDVYDRGPGIEEQHLSQIFEPFFTTSTTGTGLGLYLAKERCEFNFATLSYCQEEGHATDHRLQAALHTTSHTTLHTTKAERNNTDQESSDTSNGFFRIIFAHPDQLLPATT